MHIHILSPSVHIIPEYIDQAQIRLEAHGHRVTVGKHAKGKFGRFAGREEERIADLQDALNKEDIDVILCSRGGYGLAQIVDKIDFSPLQQHPKLLVGFSDITVLHNVWARHSMPSLHALMTKHIATLPENDEALLSLFHCLKTNTNTPYPLIVPPHPLNRFGETTGILRGGNLSVLYGLRNTPFDLPDDKNTILFIEDVAEHAYHIDRMMQNLRLSGVLSRIKGLIIGQFSECEDDPSMMSSIMESIAHCVKDYEYPLCFNFPAGHVDYNLPLLFNTSTCLNINEQGAYLTYNTSK